MSAELASTATALRWLRAGQAVDSVGGCCGAHAGCGAAATCCGALIHTHAHAAPPLQQCLVADGALHDTRARCEVLALREHGLCAWRACSRRAGVQQAQCATVAVSWCMCWCLLVHLPAKVHSQPPGWQEEVQACRRAAPPWCLAHARVHRPPGGGAGWQGEVQA
jgi:hypothetical protein